MNSVLVLILVFIAAFAGTVSGFGTSTILVPVLSLSYPFPETLLFVGIIHWFGDIWKMVFFSSGIRWKLILMFGIPGIIITFAASKLPTILPESQLKQILGAFLIIYVAFLFIKPRWKLKQNSQNAIIGGSLSGFFAGLFGVGGAVRGAFLSTYNLKSSIYVFTSGAIGFLIDSSRIAGYLSGGIRLADFNYSILFTAVIVSLAGAYVAKRVVDKTPQEKFRLLVALALLLVGIRYLVF